MDTLKILLGATVALLLGALGVSLYQGKAPASDEALETAKINRKIEELRLEQDRLAIEKQRLALQQVAAQAPPVVQTPAPAAEMEAMKEQIALLEAEKQKAERDAETADREAAFVGGKVLENRNIEARRARMIADAMLIARVKEWVEDPQLGGFATLEVVMSENVQPGSVLCIRRNTGILGKLRVSDVSVEGAIASPMSAFGESKPQPGDELILEPIF